MPLLEKTSGMSSVIEYFLCAAPGFLCARKSGATTAKGNSTCASS